MKFTLFAAAAFLVSGVSAAAVEKRDVPANLIPQFGLRAGLNPTGTGDCDGVKVNGKAIKIPCSCPPNRNDFIKKLNANVRAGHATNNPSIRVAFPTGGSKGDKLARIDAALVTLQNLRGPGQGCPASSTTFVAQRAAIKKRSGAGVSKRSVASLAPNLGFTKGKNPTGTGDCDGAVKVNGKAIKIPCACPPSQADFVKALTKNVNAKKVVNNPGIPFSFPSGNAKGDRIARIQAGLVTLQNLNGPGRGCPASSSTLGAQLKALTG